MMNDLCYVCSNDSPCINGLSENQNDYMKVD